MKALAAQEQRRVDENGNPTTDRKMLESFILSASRILSYSTVYRLPALKALEHKFTGLDLSKLTDAQLTQLVSLVAAASVDGGTEGGNRQTAH